MKPNPEQDADRAAFEKWREQQDNSMLRAETAWQTIERAFYAGQAAKADSRALQDACAVLVRYDFWSEGWNVYLEAAARTIREALRKKGV